MQVEGARMLRVKAVAEMFDVSISTIYRAIEAGQLDAYKIGSGKHGAIRIPEYAVRAFREVCADAAYQAYVLGGVPAESTSDEPVEGDGVTAKGSASGGASLARSGS